MKASRRYDHLTIDEKIKLALVQLPLALDQSAAIQSSKALSIGERQERMELFVTNKCHLRNTASEIGIDKATLSEQVASLPDWYRNLLKQISAAANRRGVAVGQRSPRSKTRLDAISEAVKARKAEIERIATSAIEQMENRND